MRVHVQRFESSAPLSNRSLVVSPSSSRSFSAHTRIFSFHLLVRFLNFFFQILKLIRPPEALISFRGPVEAGTDPVLREVLRPHLRVPSCGSSSRGRQIVSDR
uniref:Uncharacterized protein n=1 Tax=Kalanchoe fedtschenkoi TaxID=63787 RepID=A0A7N0U5U4_KALFE